MCYENEIVIDQWGEENRKTCFAECDGTERKDGGNDRNDVPDIDDFENADKDYADRENEDWDAMVEAIEDELHDQIEWLYYPTPQMFSQLETLAHQWAKDNTILPHIANEAIADCIKDIKRRKESLTDKDPAPKNETKRISHTEYYGDHAGTLQSYDVYL
jgi:hypothetical protein